MLMYNVIVVYCVLILCAKSTKNNNTQVATSKKEEKKPLKDSDDELKQTFAKLLKTIVTVNEGRILAMKKMTRLQDYMLTKNKLKTDDNMDDSMEEEDNRILLDFPEMQQFRRTEEKMISRAMCNKFMERNNFNLWMNRFKMACQSHAVALCESTCENSVSKLCENFNCNKNSRRHYFKIVCLDDCRNYFEHDQ